MMDTAQANCNHSTREILVDTVKICACVLVAVGHFFQSMTGSGILSSNGLLAWFDRTIYYFHVPLFFICSGYLYQKISCVRTVSAWKKSCIKEIINTGNTLCDLCRSYLGVENRIQ